MCGIFATIGQSTDATKKTFNGLKDIEYRGYDSWGLAWIEGGKFKIDKDTGFLPKTYKLKPTTLSLGHTRWATHGRVTKANAHPHSDCNGKIVLVHNGIVENYLDLKSELGKHKFKSETDSEVIAHLIEETLIKTPNFLKAVAEVFNRLHGLNAIVVSNGEEIVACKKGSPLVAGELEDGFALGFGSKCAFAFDQKTALY
jgi:glucosamine--fructose-6-phosphate aminotransferase (isomerizing)